MQCSLYDIILALFILSQINYINQGVTIVLAGPEQPRGEFLLVLQLLHGAVPGGGRQAESVHVEGREAGDCLQLRGRPCNSPSQ